MKPHSSETFLSRLLAKLAEAIHRRPRWFIWPHALLLLVCVAYTIDSLQFMTSRDALVGSNEKYHENYLKLRREFPHQYDIVAVVESGDAERNRQFIERLGAKLEAERIHFPVESQGGEPSEHRLLPWLRSALHFKSADVAMAETNLFVNVFFKGDLKMLGSKALMFLEEEDLRDLRRTFKEYGPFLERFTQATNLVSLFDMVNRQIRTARQETNAENAALVRILPALERIINQADAALERPGIPPSPGLTALFSEGDDADQQTYITFGSGRMYLITAQAPMAELNETAVRRMRELIEETRAEVPGVNVGLTGEPVLDSVEMEQSQKDTTLASVVALVLCALIFIYGYHETGRPIKATASLVVGLAYTMAFATLAVGHLNLLTITFAPMLIGLAIDFGVHLVTRFEEELRHGRLELEALRCAMVFTGKGIFTGAITTAAGFLAMTFTDFKGIQEMGIICGGGLLISLVPMMTLLPALLLKGRQNVLDQAFQEPVHRARARIEQLWLARPGATIIVTGGLCLLALSQTGKVFFDYNLLNLQSKDLPAVQTELKLINATTKSVIYGAMVATNLEQAADLEARILQLPSVASADSITTFLQPSPRPKLEMIGDIQRALAVLQFAPPDESPVDVAELSRTLYSLAGYFSAAMDAVQNEDPELAERFASLRSSIIELRKEMVRRAERDPALAARQLAIYQQALFHEVRDTFRVLQTQDSRDRLQVEDLPPALRERFVGVTGQFLLQIYPKKDAWQRVNQEEFIRELRTVDPNVTGTPVQVYEYTELLKKSYEEAAWYSLAAISLMVLIHFRRVSALALALLPVGVGTLWMVGLMGFFGLPFNPANIMTLPLVIGIGVTNGIHILNRFAEEQDPSILTKSTGKAVVVSGLTTIAGFGSLILAKHQGIESLGFVMSMGTAACMVAGLTFLPALLVMRMKMRKKNQPSAATE